MEGSQVLEADKRRGRKKIKTLPVITFFSRKYLFIIKFLKDLVCTKEHSAMVHNH